MALKASPSSSFRVFLLPVSRCGGFQIAALGPCCLQCWQPLRDCKRSHKKTALANLKVRSPIEHIWSWKEHCLNADKFTKWVLTSAGVPAAFICQTYAYWGKSISLSRDKDTVGPSCAPGSSRAMHPGLGVEDSSCSWALQHPLLPRASLPPATGKHRAKGFAATASPAPLFLPDISSPTCSTTPHSPSGAAREKQAGSTRS